jgi:hypothetical protein
LLARGGFFGGFVPTTMIGSVAESLSENKCMLLVRTSVNVSVLWVATRSVDVLVLHVIGCRESLADVDVAIDITVLAA